MAYVISIAPSLSSHFLRVSERASCGDGWVATAREGQFRNPAQGRGERTSEGGRLRLLWVVMSRSLSLSGSTNGPLARQRYVGIGERGGKRGPVRPPRCCPRSLGQMRLSFPSRSLYLVDPNRHGTARTSFIWTRPLAGSRNERCSCWQQSMSI